MALACQVPDPLQNQTHIKKQFEIILLYTGRDSYEDSYSDSYSDYYEDSY